MLNGFSRVWLLSTLWTIAHQAPLSMGFSRQRYWSEFPCPSPGDLPRPGIQPASLATPAVQADSLLLRHRGSPDLRYVSAVDGFRAYNISFPTCLCSMLRWHRDGISPDIRQLFLFARPLPPPSLLPQPLPCNWCFACQLAFACLPGLLR